ncbi:transporter substrate-binding domain-containing protein [Acuticoccus sp. M5D2P5]|uniref:transporter substrate-binding domain-containing protein n=1 Tax=Acuticoccus kalidii TaxID=2910977 RepID=UPI001F4101F1|nr:transporter substrate-binding domain-containing protein [Acuticoccus kalidii]MCF3935199.1 transporter substrate-binding domain-containing protein [Acuticoccus kalidii]
MVKLAPLCTAIVAVTAVVGTAPAFAQDMPPLPTSIEEAGVVRVGTKCDYPPEGYLDMSGTPVGVEVAMGHQIAKYAFGDDAEAEIVCVTAANRIPSLVGGKVDLVIATMGINAEREEVIDFSQPYAWSSSGVLVRADDDTNTLAGLNGKTVAFLKGAWQIPFFDESYPEVDKLLLDGVSDSLQALMQNRVDGYAHDTPVLMSIAANNDQVRLIDEVYKIGTRGAAVRPGETEWLDYVNASLTRMADEGKFVEWFKEHADDENLEDKLKFWDMSQMPQD